MAVGGGINAKINNEATSRQNQENQLSMDISRNARVAEDERQRAWELQQSTSAGDALNTADPAVRAEEVAAAVADPTNEFANVAQDYNVPTLQGQIQGGSTAEAIGRIVNDALKRTKGMLTSASTLTSQGESANKVALAIGRMGGEIANVGSNRQGSINVANLETSLPAATVTPNASMIGDLLMLGGQLGAGVAGKSVGTQPLKARGISGPLFGGRGVFDTSRDRLFRSGLVY